MSVLDPIRQRGMALSDLAAELERQQLSKRDYVVDTRSLGFYSSEKGSEISIDSKEGIVDYAVSDHTHGQIADRLGVPKRYYDRLRSEAPGLLDQNVRHWFAQKPETRMIRTLDGRARAFLSDRYRPLDNYDLAQHVLPILGGLPGVEFQNLQLSENRLYLRAIVRTIEREIRVGDVVYAGVEIGNSEIGSGSLYVGPRIWRLVCANGMVVPDATTRKYHVGRKLDETEMTYSLFSDETIAADDAAFFLKVRDLVSAAVDETKFDLIVGMLREATEVEIPPSAASRLVETTTKEYGLTETEGENVLGHLIAGGDLTQYGLAQAITRTAQDVENVDREAEFERLGGEVVSLRRREWEALLA